MKISDMVLKVRHLGVYVEDIDASVALYKKLYDIADDDVRMMPPPGTKDPESRFAFIPLGAWSLS